MFWLCLLASLILRSTVTTLWRQEDVMKIFFWGLVSILLIGCSSHSNYEPDVFSGGRVNHQNLHEIATIDEDIMDFAQDVYVEAPIEISDTHVFVNEELELPDNYGSDISYIDYPDTHFFVTYCDSISGKVMTWTIQKKYERLRGRGIGKKFYTCEVNGEVDGAIMYFVKSKYPHYKVEKHYLTNEGFKKYRELYKTFISKDDTCENEELSIDRSSLYDPIRGLTYRSYSHPIHLKFENRGDKVKTYDINKLSLTINGQSYETKVIKVKNKRKISHEKIVLSPGEIYEDDVVVKIRLLRGYNEEHVLGSNLSIDGHQFTNFKEADSYDIDKIGHGDSVQITSYQ